MKLQHATRYAIWSTIELASREGQQVSATELAAIYGISQHHLAKVLRTLARARIVTSVRGPGGGFMFAGRANRLTLADIISLFERDWPAADPADDLPETTVAAEVGRVLDEIDRITQATLRSVTVQTIINNAKRAARSRDKAADQSAGPAIGATRTGARTGAKAATSSATGSKAPSTARHKPASRSPDG